MRKSRARILFDAAPYAHAPPISVGNGVTLCRALVRACPDSAPANVKKARKSLEATADEAEAELTARNRALGAYPEEDSRALDNLADRAWGALRMRIDAMAMLDPSEFPLVSDAVELGARLFPSGTGFLSLDYAQQATAMSAELRLVDEDGLGKRIDKVAGPQFLAAVRGIQPRYERMVQERMRRDAATGQNLLETARELQAAIADYAQKVVGMVDRDDPDTVAVVREMLRPIDAFREAMSRAPAAEPEADAQPTPPAPPK